MRNTGKLHSKYNTEEEGTQVQFHIRIGSYVIDTPDHTVVQ